MFWEDQRAAAVMAHQSHEGRSWTGGFLSYYRVVYTVGLVVKLKETHTATNRQTNYKHINLHPSTGVHRQINGGKKANFKINFTHVFCSQQASLSLS